MERNNLRRRIGSQQILPGALETKVDVIFVIDGSESMQNGLEDLKSRILSIPDAIEENMASKNRRIVRMRVKVIVFRDVYRDTNAFEKSDWFIIPGEQDKFREFLEGIRAEGGSDGPRSGLEALRLAISEFEPLEGRGRQFIILMTDAPAHRLDDPRRNNDPAYPEWMNDCHTLEGLETIWEELNVRYRRMYIIAPNAYPWTTMQNWVPVCCEVCPSGQGIAIELIDVLYSLFGIAIGGVI